jgi:2,3-bisphosphoglycerate-independent phosphoglycerate mutase
VTYFLNGGREEPFDGEDRVLIESLKVKDFSKTPQMRAKEITKQTLKAIEKDYDAIIVNYSNPDMIGHTGNYKAVVKSLEFVDKCLNELVGPTDKAQYQNLENFNTADPK